MTDEEREEADFQQAKDEAFLEYAIEKKNNKCDDCGKPSETDLCQDCCEHDEHEHGYCIECNKNIVDDLIGRAELLEDR